MLWTILTIAVCVYGAICLFFLVFQRSFIYMPTPATPMHTAAVALEVPGARLGGTRGRAVAVFTRPSGEKSFVCVSPRVSVVRLWQTITMSLTNDEFDRLERMIYRPVSTRPDWLKAWRNEAQYLLYLARRAVDADDEELVQELEEQAREMADVVEAKLQSDGLL